MNKNFCLDFFEQNALLFKNLYDLYQKDHPELSEGEFLNLFHEILKNLSDWTKNQVRARAKELDSQGAGILQDHKTVPNKFLKAFYEEAANLGLLGLSASKSLGGMGLPLSLSFMGFALVAKECLSSSAQLGFFLSMIDMVKQFCSLEDQEELIPQIIQGQLSGCMCLTEPEAGSDLSQIKTFAKKKDHSWYEITGTKIFITNGGGGFAFVLAKTKEGDDLNHLSLFLVKQEENNYKVTKIEDKMGLHGSFTCELVFNRSKGKLLGEEGSGFKKMLHLMNEARLAVGLQALGALEDCYERSLKYASERQQFKTYLKDFPMVHEMLIEMNLIKEALAHYLLKSLLHYDFLQKGNENYKNIVRKKTPLIKMFSTEVLTYQSQRAIQIFGGYGFMKDYEIERIHRDSFALLIYEGTSQIQSLMALKDYFKNLKNIFKFKKLYHLNFLDLIKFSLFRTFFLENFSFHCTILYLALFRRNQLMKRTEFFAKSLALLDISYDLILDKKEISREFISYMKTELSYFKKKLCQS